MREEELLNAFDHGTNQEIIVAKDELNDARKELKTDKKRLGKKKKKTKRKHNEINIKIVPQRLLMETETIINLKADFNCESDTLSDDDYIILILMILIALLLIFGINKYWPKLKRKLGFKKKVRFSIQEKEIAEPKNITIDTNTKPKRGLSSSDEFDAADQSTKPQLFYMSGRYMVGSNPSNQLFSRKNAELP